MLENEDTPVCGGSAVCGISIHCSPLPLFGADGDHVCEGYLCCDGQVSKSELLVLLAMLVYEFHSNFSRVDQTKVNQDDVDT